MNSADDADFRPLLTTAQVARQLGVKAETVYAYVSRGQLASIRTPGQRGSRFDPAEVDRLMRGDTPEDGSSGRRAPAGAAESIRTGITLIEPDAFFYRGRAATELAASTTYDQVARLLWSPALGDGERLDFVSAPAALAVARGAVGALPAAAGLPERLRVAVAAIAAADPLRYDSAPDAIARTAATLIATAVAALGPFRRTAPASGVPDSDVSASGVSASDVSDPPGSVAGVLWSRLTEVSAEPEFVALLDAALVLLADHDLAASTLAVRVAASVRANIYAVVSAGLGAFDGPAHGGASREAYRFLADAADQAAGGPAAALEERLRSGRRLGGFGQPVYATADPRAVFLLSGLRDLAGAGGPQSGAVTSVLRTVDELVALAERPGRFPNVDLALAAMAHAFAMPVDAGETIFAVARMAGWVAHALEEYAEPARRFRPRGVYVGPPRMSSPHH